MLSPKIFEFFSSEAKVEKVRRKSLKIEEHDASESEIDEKD